MARNAGITRRIARHVICPPCHLPIEGTVYPELAVVPPGYKCVVSGEKKGATIILLCNEC